LTPTPTNGDQQRRPGPLHGGEEAAQHDEGAEEGHPPHERPQVVRRRRGDRGLLARREQQRFRVPEQRPGRQGQGHEGPQRLPRAPAQLAHPAAARAPSVRRDAPRACASSGAAASARPKVGACNAQ
jgi:hypothetical protein